LNGSKAQRRNFSWLRGEPELGKQEVLQAISQQYELSVARYKNRAAYSRGLPDTVEKQRKSEYIGAS